jgi:hypothetical protein
MSSIHQLTKLYEWTDLTEMQIRDQVSVVLLGISDEPINGKLDTGAGCCSLNAQQIHCDDTEVSFLFKGKKFRMRLDSKQQIQTADGGTEVRPVISVNCKIDGKVINDVKINLNDRGELSDLLVGMNLIKLIDG